MELLVTPFNDNLYSPTSARQAKQGKQKSKQKLLANGKT